MAAALREANLSPAEVLYALSSVGSTLSLNLVPSTAAVGNNGGPPLVGSLYHFYCTGSLSPRKNIETIHVDWREHRVNMKRPRTTLTRISVSRFMGASSLLDCRGFSVRR